MAIDPKAKRAAIHYQGGRVVGALGLLEHVFAAQPTIASAEVVTDSRGRRRLKNVGRAVSAVGGKQLRLVLKTGEVYQVHYSGALVDWRLHGVPMLDRSVVMGWKTNRKTSQSVL